MSELIHRQDPRLEGLTTFALGLIQGKGTREFFELHRPLIETVTPEETMRLFDTLLANGLETASLKAVTGKLINAFYKSLSAFSWELPDSSHFLSFLIQENRSVEERLNKMKEIVKRLSASDETERGQILRELASGIQEMKEYELHYIKKENILFPYIEKAFPSYRCLQVMWSFHDDFRASVKHLEQLLASGTPDFAVLNRELGKLYFVLLPVIFREEKIVFPVALRAIPDSGWAAMLRESLEIGWCYGVNPKPSLLLQEHPTANPDKINPGTGLLSVEQLVLLFRHLPVDITFVDEQDEVAFFSDNAERIFPRSPAIIGRKVQNCHPPESVSVVNEIVAAFRTGQQDHADFWIQMRGRFLLIRYFAIRDAEGHYRGTLEVSQDATEVRALQGERRLLEWKRE
ncbi:MAG: PAS domain-containing protein [Marinilabiliales bacterium]|nr:PAS domain-containing protein [Marinilabiliales bacterium]